MKRQKERNAEKKEKININYLQVLTKMKEAADDALKEGYKALRGCGDRYHN